MRTVMRWLSGLVVVGALLALATWAYIESRKELERERQFERPVEAPERLSRLASGEVIVNVDIATRSRIGLGVKTLEARTIPREKTAHGRVLDPSSLISLCSDLAAGEISLVASQADYERLEVLYVKSKNVSRRELESAEARYRADELRVRTALRRISDDWGPPLAELDAASRETLLDRLARRQTAFVRVNLPGSEILSVIPTGASITIFGADGVRIEADAVHAAPKIDARLQGQAFLLRIDSVENRLQPGAAVTGYLRLPGEPHRGVVIPRAAVVRFEGKTWVYIRHGGNEFVRKAVALDRPLPTGWLTTGVISTNSEVVVAGAQLLLSEELRAEIEVEDEGEE